MLDDLENINDLKPEMDETTRRRYLVEYVDFIKKCGFDVIKCIAKKDYLYDMKVYVAFELNSRKVNGFFMVTKYSEFSLNAFCDQVANGTNAERSDFERAIKARIVPYTDEEVLCALLSDNYDLTIPQVIKDNKLVIPNESFDRLFELMNFKAGNLPSRTQTRNK